MTIHNMSDVVDEIYTMTPANGSTWLRVWPAPPFSIPARGEQRVTITAVVLGLPPGTYQDRLLVYTNDPMQNPVADGVYVTLTVPQAPGDGDGDGDVDHDDLLRFEACASGPAVPHSGTPTCQAVDFDSDGDVDQDDFAVLQRCWSGANRRADPRCAD